MHLARLSGIVPTAMEPDLVYDLSPREAAALINVHEDTLKRWATQGKVPAFRTPGGWWRFRRADLVRFMASSIVDPEAATA